MSTLDADKYRLNIPAIKHLTKHKTPKERHDFIGAMAISTGVPIIIVASYMGEIYGFDSELLLFIERLKKFYNIKNVLNVQKEVAWAGKSHPVGCQCEEGCSDGE